MTGFELSGTPTDRADGVLAVGRGDAIHLFVSLSARDPEGRDADYLRWHALDHRPEQHRLRQLRGALRLVSTPDCRRVRGPGAPEAEPTDHVMTYLFAGIEELDRFFALGAALGRAGRMALRLPSVGIDLYTVDRRVAAPGQVLGADVLPWRTWTGVYLLIEDLPVGDQTSGAFDEVIEVAGVAGAWSAIRTPQEDTEEVWPTRPGEQPRRITYFFLDDDPVEVGRRLRGLMGRGADTATPVLAAPFHPAVDHEWERHLP